MVAADEAGLGGDEVGGEEGVGDVVGGFDADDASSEDEDVHFVVLDALMSRVMVVAHAGADAGNLVGGNADADTRTADEDAAGGYPVIDGVAYGLGSVGVVGGGGGMDAEVDDLMALGGEVGADIFFEEEAGVVGADY